MRNTEIIATGVGSVVHGSDDTLTGKEEATLNLPGGLRMNLERLMMFFHQEGI